MLMSYFSETHACYASASLGEPKNRLRSPEEKIMSNMHVFLRGAVAATAVIILTFAAWASAADIVDDWAKVQPPPPPKLKAVTLDGPTTALIFMDMNQIQCAQNPRCAATVPAFRRLYDAGRAAGAMFWYSLSN